jgi:hypothetical protein
MRVSWRLKYVAIIYCFIVSFRIILKTPHLISSDHFWRTIVRQFRSQIGTYFQHPFVSVRQSKVLGTIFAKLCFVHRSSLKFCLSVSLSKFLSWTNSRIFKRTSDRIRVRTFKQFRRNCDFLDDRVLTVSFTFPSPSVSHLCHSNTLDLFRLSHIPQNCTRIVSTLPNFSRNVGVNSMP